MNSIAEELFSIAGKIYNEVTEITDELAYSTSSVIAAPSSGNKLLVTWMCVDHEAADQIVDIGDSDGNDIFTSVYRNGVAIFPLIYDFSDCPLVVDDGDDLRVKQGATGNVQTFIVRGYEVPA